MTSCLITDIEKKAPVHLLKVARLIRLARLLQKIDRFSQYSALVLALLMSMFTLLAHWLACIWYAIGHVEFENNTTAGWLWELSERLDLNNHIGGNGSRDNETTVKPDVLMSYLSALYFTCSSLTSVGFGNVSANTNSEKIFSICAMIVGALMHAVVFGNVTALIQRMYQRRANFHSKTKDLKDFFRAYDIPKPLKQRMQEYFQTMWSMNNGIETNEILKDFPEEMKGELGLHLHKEILNLPIFEEATQGCLKSIALHTRRSFCAPGEFLVHKGDASNYLYLLVSGSMEVLKMDMVVAILGKADLFGSDIDFDDPISVCNYDVRSLTYSELQCISIKGLTDVLLLYPDFAEKFAKDIHNDLTYNLRQTGEDSDEEAESTPKTRVCTLPSISEDDELSPSDDDDDDVKPLPVEKSGDDDDMESSIGGHSINSPLLPTGRIFPKLPNGDITMEAVSSPPSIRPWGIRRASGIMSRQSIKETRKIRLGSHTPETTEKIIPHVQTLQTEMEGTKAAIGKLERKVSRISQDISAIDRNMREILKHLNNASSRMSPLEPLPPHTPSTPCPNAHFNFDFPESYTNDARQRASCESISGISSRIHRRPGKDEFDPRRRSSLQVPTFFRHRELVGRRHSDGSKKGDDDESSLNLSDIMSKSECNVRDNGSGKSLSDMEETGLRLHDKLIDFSDDISVVETDYSLSTDNLSRSRSRLPSANTKTSSERGSDDKLEFMGKLEEVHSDDCNTPKDLHVVKDVCDNKPIICDKGFVKKSSTFDTFRTVPKVTVNKDISMPALKLQCIHNQNHNHFIDHEIITKRETGIFLETLSSPVKSKSCVDISPKHTCSKIPKAKSHGFIETEFDAKTPNEVRTIHFKGNKENEKRLTITDDIIDDELVNTEKQKLMTHVRKASKDSLKELDKVVFKNDKVKLQKFNQLDQTSPDSIGENMKTDSGHVSLPENIDSDSDNDNGETASKLQESSGIEHLLASVNNEPTGIRNVHEKLRRLKPDISPDSLTDISESLISDSVKTEDDTVIDMDHESTVMNDIFGPLMDTSLMRTTDL
ncbi:Potassium voltage-gated channel subfamily H member 4 [Mactra antiquata]